MSSSWVSRSVAITTGDRFLTLRYLIRDSLKSSMTRLTSFSVHLECLKRRKCKLVRILTEKVFSQKLRKTLPKRADKACRTNCMHRLLACFPVRKVTSSTPTSIKSKPDIKNFSNKFQSSCKILQPEIVIGISCLT